MGWLGIPASSRFLHSFISFNLLLVLDISSFSCVSSMKRLQVKCPMKCLESGMGELAATDPNFCLEIVEVGLF